MRKSTGFTLMEILIVLVIMGVLAGLALPAYFHTVEQSRSGEAKTNLTIIHMGQKIYRLNNSVYFADGSPTVAEANAGLNTDMSSIHYDLTELSANGGTDYTAEFTRNAVDGGAGSKTFTYTYTDGDTAPVLTEGGNY